MIFEKPFLFLEKPSLVFYREHTVSLYDPENYAVRASSNEMSHR